MIAVPVTVSQLLEDPELCERLMGAMLIVKLNTSVGTLKGHLLQVDTAQGRTLTLLVADQETGRRHILFVFTDSIVSMMYDDNNRLPDAELRNHRQQSHFITA